MKRRKAGLPTLSFNDVQRLIDEQLQRIEASKSVSSGKDLKPAGSEKRSSDKSGELDPVCYAIPNQNKLQRAICRLLGLKMNAE
jgi:hypothetical protein